jgi:hypothetical protein
MVYLQLLERAAQVSGLLSDSNKSKMSILHQSELVAPIRYTSTMRFPSTTIPVVDAQATAS